MTGLWVLLGAITLALGFGAYRRVTDGKARTVADGAPQLDASRLGSALGSRATLVQFSSTVCAPCRATHRLLNELFQDDPSVAHIDINAEERLDLVSEFDILRTPTVLLLDADGRVRNRIVGAARKDEVIGALDQLALRTAA